jgi:hypothetical protein
MHAGRAPPACCAEALLGLICDQLHLHLAPDAMRAGDDANLNKVILQTGFVIGGLGAVM